MKFTAVLCAVLALAQASDYSYSNEKKEEPYHDVWAVEETCPLFKPCPRPPALADGEWWLTKGSCLDDKKKTCGLERNQKPCACILAKFKSNSYCEFATTYSLDVYAVNTTCNGSVKTNYQVTVADSQNSMAIFSLTRQDTGSCQQVAGLVADNHQTFFAFGDCSSKAVYIFVKKGKTISAKSWDRINCALINNGIDPESLCEFNYSDCKSPDWAA